jgi:hypothetical protein
MFKKINQARSTNNLIPVPISTLTTHYLQIIHCYFCPDFIGAKISIAINSVNLLTTHNSSNKNNIGLKIFKSLVENFQKKKEVLFNICLLFFCACERKRSSQLVFYIFNNFLKEKLP